MRETYEGQHAPELICAVDEYTLESAGEEIWEKETARALADGYEKNFSSIQKIEIEVDQDEIRRILIGSHTIKGSVVAPEAA